MKLKEVEKTKISEQTATVKLLEYDLLAIGKGCMQYLTNVSKSLLRSCLGMSQDLVSSVLDHVYVCTLHVRGLLCASVQLVYT